MLWKCLKLLEERGRTKQLTNTQAGGKLFKLCEWKNFIGGRAVVSS